MINRRDNNYLYTFFLTFQKQWKIDSETLKKLGKMFTILLSLLLLSYKAEKKLQWI